LGIGSHLKHWGVSEDKITELDWWQSAELDQFTFTAAPARHFSGRSLTDGKKTQWASWVLQGQYNNLYFSGDGDYADHFKEIGEKYGPFDFTMLECGQYNPMWEAHTHDAGTNRAGQYRPARQSDDARPLGRI
tara:strand:- start:313 stop:711 length:399 start_codon:yes stop_codon:yes gene_type:complete